jgi:hypothetical protein
VYIAETSHSFTARLGFFTQEYGWGAQVFGEFQSNLGEKIEKKKYKCRIYVQNMNPLKLGAKQTKGIKKVTWKSCDSTFVRI